MDPMQQLVAMRGQMQGPMGPGQGMGGPQLGAPPAANPSAAPPDPHGLTNGNQQDLLEEFARKAVRSGDVPTLAAHIREIQRMHPKLSVVAHDNGHAELIGPARDQFVAAAYARSHGAKVAHVRNSGRGQRLHLEFGS